MRTLELKCKAPAWFDPETQRYELCPGRLEATVEQAGQKLDCPVCGAPMEVPSAAYFQKHAPRPEPEKPPLDLEDEFQLAPETPRGKAPARATPASTPSPTRPSAEPAAPAKGGRDEEFLAVGDLSGDDDPSQRTPIRHSDEERWMEFAGDAEPPPMSSRVRELMDEDDGGEYQVSGPTAPPPTSAASSSAAPARGGGDVYDDYATGDRAPSKPADSKPADDAVDLSGFEDDVDGQEAPAEDWLSAPLPGAEPVRPGFDAPALPSHATVAGQLTDASRVLAPAKTEWVPRHRILAAQEIACPNCRSSLQRDVELCERCGYHLRLKRVVRSYEPPKEHVGGFDFWLKKHLHEHASVGGMKAMVGVLGPILIALVMIILWFVVGIFSLCLFVPLGMLLILVVAICLIPGPRGSDPFNFWWATLQLQRLSGWKFMHQSTVPLGVVERKSRDFGDAELDQMPELETADVLDLEGSSVTDEGIMLLRFYKNLKFLVVRDTKVTALGVKNLQYEFPELLIWR